MILTPYYLTPPLKLTTQLTMRQHEASRVRQTKETKKHIDGS
jgi:hypothetical protein